jgi:SpoVK/Ycf46/Vps4 family AAA+-type ATPase
MEWSQMHRNLLASRIDRQPSYSISNFKAAEKSALLGSVLFKLGYATARSDGSLNRDERFFLDNLRGKMASGEASDWEDEIEGILGGSNQSGTVVRSRSESVPENARAGGETVENLLGELDGLIGLQGVKDEIRRLVSFLEIQQKRREASLPQTLISLHMVFSGNPGTGKTTVARMVSRIYRALGILEKGHLVETDRSGLVGQYVGHTANKTLEMIDSSMHGTLFIDEAYSLVQAGSENDFGRESVDTLVKQMEDRRGKFVVITAGYPEEMENFILSNPGLKSRFNTFINFENFSAEELISIFRKFCESNEYQLNAEAEMKLNARFSDALQNSDRSFGNGRFARNLFEQVIRNQALRLWTIKEPLSKAMLTGIEPQDILAG